MLREILEDRKKPPLERLRNLVHAFIRSECAEAEMRVALNDAAPLYRDAPEAKEARGSGARTMQVFMEEALHKASKATCTLAGDLIGTTLNSVGKKFSESRHTPGEIDAYSEAIADMFWPTSGLSSRAKPVGFVHEIRVNRDGRKLSPASAEF